MSMQIRCVCVDLDKWLCTTELAMSLLYRSNNQSNLHHIWCCFVCCVLLLKPFIQPHDTDICVLITTEKQFTSDSESVVFQTNCTPPRTIPTTTYDAAICVLINSDHKSPQKRVSIPWMMFDGRVRGDRVVIFCNQYSLCFHVFVVHIRHIVL